MRIDVRDIEWIYELEGRGVLTFSGRLGQSFAFTDIRANSVVGELTFSREFERDFGQHLQIAKDDPSRYCYNNGKYTVIDTSPRDEPMVKVAGLDFFEWIDVSYQFDANPKGVDFFSRRSKQF